MVGISASFQCECYPPFHLSKCTFLLFHRVMPCSLEINDFVLSVNHTAKITKEPTCNYMAPRVIKQENICVCVRAHAYERYNFLSHLMD